MRLAWIALAAALVGLLLVMAGAVTRRLGLSDFYTRPCFELAVLLTAVAFIAAIDARFLGRESFRLGVLALATNAVVTLFVLVLVEACRAGLCSRLSCRGGDLSRALQHREERPGDGLCPGFDRRRRGAHALVRRAVVPESGRPIASAAPGHWVTGRCS